MQYDRYVEDKEKLPFDLALELRPIALVLKHLARRAIDARGGV